jgi:hypothetical protein
MKGAVPPPTTAAQRLRDWSPNIDRQTVSSPDTTRDHFKLIARQGSRRHGNPINRDIGYRRDILDDPMLLGVA